MLRIGKRVVPTCPWVSPPGTRSICCPKLSEPKDPSSSTVPFALPTSSPTGSWRAASKPTMWCSTGTLDMCEGGQIRETFRLFKLNRMIECASGKPVCTPARFGTGEVVPCQISGHRYFGSALLQLMEESGADCFTVNLDGRLRFARDFPNIDIRSGGKLVAARFWKLKPPLDPNAQHWFSLFLCRSAVSQMDTLQWVTVQP